MAKTTIEFFMLDLMKTLSFVKSARVRNRGGKLYLTVCYKRDTEGKDLGERYNLHRVVRVQIAQIWPKAYCTSGGPSGCTYRLNP